MAGIPLHTLRQARAWDLQPAAPGLLSWSVDPDAGLIQGPLDFGFLAGRRLMLGLEPDQVALFDEGGRLRSVMLSGLHLLDLRREDASWQGARLHFLHLDRPLVLPWRRPLPLRGAGAGARFATGVFCVRIVEPCAFHAAFLRDGGGGGEQGVRERLAALLPTFLAIRLTRSGEDLQDDARLAAAVREVEPAELDADLAAYGLACDAVALHPPSGSLSEPLIPAGAGF